MEALNIKRTDYLLSSVQRPALKIKRGMKAKVLAQQMVARNFGRHGVQTPLCASGHAGLRLPTACLIPYGQLERFWSLGKWS